MRGPIAPRDDVAKGDPRAGYVLIEAVATLAIAVLLLRLSLPFVSFGTTPPRLLALVTSSVSLLRDVRTAAMVANRPAAARFEAGGRRLSGATSAIEIPEDVAFSLLAGGNCPAADGKAAIVFRPDGSSCGGVLRFAKGGRVMRARVNWADGHIDVVEDR